MQLNLLIVPLLAVMALSACKKTEIVPGNDPNFTIESHSDQGLKAFPKKVEVFGIALYAHKKVDNDHLLHAANVMAQYLDNDENGQVDNQLVVDEMVARGAYMMLWNSKHDVARARAKNGEGQDLGNKETRPNWHTNGHTGDFDAALEEVWHLISHVGYANVYPSVFGEREGTTLANAMDLARGGKFTQIPDNYPADAWYSYNDKTCDYSCMATEYFYWALTSMLGAQENRLSEIEQEWQLNTWELVQQRDPAVFELLTDAQYGLPTALPDGTYMR